MLSVAFDLFFSACHYSPFHYLVLLYDIVMIFSQATFNFQFSNMTSKYNVLPVLYKPYHQFQ